MVSPTAQIAQTQPHQRAREYASDSEREDSNTYTDLSL